MNLQDKVSKIEENDINLENNLNTSLEEVPQYKPVNYWDNIEVDTLLTLQKPRTNFVDEEVFIIYHQIKELILKMMVSEIKQMIYKKSPSETFLISKFNRLNRFTKILISSFDIINERMDYDGCNTFTTMLTPSSGFQSMQFRLVEIYCTNIENLVSDKNNLLENSKMEDAFEDIYWKIDSIDNQTGKKPLTLVEFENRYEHRYIALAKKVKGKTIENIIINFTNPSEKLISKFKEFDQLYNVDYPQVHINTAKQYPDNKDAAAGDQAKKQLNPKHQSRTFFPSLYTAEEIV